MKNKNENLIDQLQLKLELLSRKQQLISKEIEELRTDLQEIVRTENEEDSVVEQGVAENALISSIVDQNNTTSVEASQKPENKTSDSQAKKAILPTIKLDWEKFIGENLANKIGIAITIIGVSIGVKYSFDHQLISPLMRVILGYIFGIIMLAVGFKLKKNFKNFSAVLVSGAMAIMYFITFSAYSFYSLYPQSIAFVIMVVFTIFTVLMAVKFNLQLIAHIGLVGAYAVPFLLSDGSGKIVILLSYMSIINIGILSLAITKYWKQLYFVSFGLSWLVFVSWFLGLANTDDYFTTILLFATIFFVTFYAIALIYKLIKKEKFNLGDVVIILINSFVYYYIVYTTLDAHINFTHYLGLFTFLNALIHLVLSIIIYKQKLADRNLFYLYFGLFITFITIAIPVQLDGNWVSLLWACEGALLFWIGRVKQVALYEKLSYPLIILSILSISHDWLQYSFSAISVPILNIGFLSAVIVFSSLLFIIYLNNKYQAVLTISRDEAYMTFVNIIVPVFFMLVLYFAFRMEINKYWTAEYLNSAIQLPNSADGFKMLEHDENIVRYNEIVLLNFTLLFLAAINVFGNKIFKNQFLALPAILLSGIAICVFLTNGLYIFSELRTNFLHQKATDIFQLTGWSIGIRYLSIIFVILLMFSAAKTVRLQIYDSYLNKNLHKIYECFVAITILWLMSSEVIECLHWNGYPNHYKIGISILWAVFALAVAVIGIWKKKAHLRWSAIILFGITIAKVMLYDIADMTSISKTIIMILLGLLLLIFSFLYNKYKSFINN